MSETTIDINLDTESVRLALRSELVRASTLNRPILEQMAASMTEAQTNEIVKRLDALQCDDRPSDDRPAWLGDLIIALLFAVGALVGFCIGRAR